MGLEECWKVISRSPLSHAADERLPGSVVQIVCYRVIVTLRDVKAAAFKLPAQRIPYSLCAGLHESLCGQPRTYSKVYFYTCRSAMCLTTWRLTSQFWPAAHFSPTQKSNKQSHAAGRILKTVHLQSEKQNRENSCPVLNFVLYKRSGAGVISDKIDQNYIIGFYSPLKT